LGKACLHLDLHYCDCCWLASSSPFFSSRHFIWLFQGSCCCLDCRHPGNNSLLSLGRTVARKFIKKWIAKRPQFTELDKAVGRKGWKIVFLTRLSPIVPSNILNYGFSLTKINFWQYFFFSWLGMLPVIALYVYLGSAGANLASGGNTPGKMALQIFGLCVTVGAVTYTTKLAKKTLSPEPASSQDKQKDISNK
jgi:hypothetical protein